MEFSKNKKKVAPNESWLTSFGDMMTLLLVFFVIQISPQAVTSKEEQSQKEKLDETIAQLQQIIKDENLQKEMSTYQNGNFAEIHLFDTLLFDVGESTLKPSQQKKLYPIINTLKNLKDTHEISIEGHTDSLPVHNYKFKSNWYLSSSRALSILEVFLEKGFKPEKLSAQGFAEFRPLVPNTDSHGKDLPQNRAKNRRVSIKIEGTDKLHKQ